MVFLLENISLNLVLGAVLDPIADKILIVFLILALSLELSSTFIGIVGGIILAREFWVIALRDLMPDKDNSNATQVTFLLKLKHSIQLSAFIVLLTGLFINDSLIILIGNFILFASLIITLQTGLEYTIKTFKNFGSTS
jgi:phosphatidylglycerophosphate synthase